MFDNTAAQLHAAIAAVCPIHGVSVGRKNDKGTWRIDFAPEATEVERQQAAMALGAFDVEKAIQDRQAKTLREEAVQLKMRELAERLVDDPTLMDKLTRAQR